MPELMEVPLYELDGVGPGSPRHTRQQDSGGIDNLGYESKESGAEHETNANQQHHSKGPISVEVNANEVPHVETVQPLADCALPLLNVFRSPRWFLVFLSLAACIQGLCINGLVNVVVTTIERRFGLQSTQTGLIAASYDIGSLLAIIPVSYLGGRVAAHKPRWIACGLMALGLGSLVWTIPHYVIPSWEEERAGAAAGQSEDSTQLCNALHNTSQSCETSGHEGLAIYRLVFILGQLLHGAGAAPLISIGTTFLDESVSKRSSPLYIGVFQTWFVIGPAIGYVVGGELLSIHTDLDFTSELKPDSSQWVGAWWPGFLLSFFMALLCSCFLFCYPARIKAGSVEAVPVEAEEAATKKGTLSSLALAALPRCVLRLLLNPTYILISLGQGMDGFIISGLSAFLPKYIEHQYALTGGVAAQLVGLMAVPGGGGGTFFGGWLIKRLNLTRTRIIVMCCASQLLALLTIFAFLGTTCPTLPYVGINHVLVHMDGPPAARGESEHGVYTSACNTNCSCSTQHFDPVCGSDNLMYLSPCFAGCATSISKANYTDCSCPMEGGTVSRSKCTSDCNMLVTFAVIQFLGIFLTFLASMPGVVATLRAVLPEERSLALGIQSIITRLVGSIPGPVLFGYVVDRVCLLWEPSCEGSKACLLYDNTSMGRSLLAVCLVAKLLSAAFYGLAIWASHRSPIKDDMPPAISKET